MTVRIDQHGPPEPAVPLCHRTPFKAQGKLCPKGLRQLMRHVIQNSTEKPSATALVSRSVSLCPGGSSHAQGCSSCPGWATAADLPRRGTEGEPGTRSGAASLPTSYPPAMILVLVFCSQMKNST